MGKLFRQIEGMLNAERTTVDGAKLLLEVSNFVICCSLHRRIFWLSRATLHAPAQSMPPVALLKFTSARCKARASRNEIWHRVGSQMATRCQTAEDGFKCDGCDMNVASFAGCIVQVLEVPGYRDMAQLDWLVKIAHLCLKKTCKLVGPRPMHRSTLSLLGWRARFPVH